MDWEMIEAIRNITYTQMTLLQAEIKMQGMIAENKQRDLLGQSMTYNAEDFNTLINQHGVNHNAVVSNLHPQT